MLFVCHKIQGDFLLIQNTDGLQYTDKPLRAMCDFLQINSVAVEFDFLIQTFDKMKITLLITTEQITAAKCLLILISNKRSVWFLLLQITGTHRSTYNQQLAFKSWRY